jgi:hypothetical protein
MHELEARRLGVRPRRRDGREYLSDARVHEPVRSRVHAHWLSRRLGARPTRAGPRQPGVARALERLGGASRQRGDSARAPAHRERRKLPCVHLPTFVRQPAYASIRPVKRPRKSCRSRSRRAHATVPSSSACRRSRDHVSSCTHLDRVERAELLVRVEGCEDWSRGHADELAFVAAGLVGETRILPSRLGG